MAPVRELPVGCEVSLATRVRGRGIGCLMLGGDFDYELVDDTCWLFDWGG